MYRQSNSIDVKTGMGEALVLKGDIDGAIEVLQEAVNSLKRRVVWTGV